MGFQPILQLSENINLISLEIDEINKKIYRLRTISDLLDNKIQGSVRIRLEILKCFLQQVKKERKNSDWNIVDLQKSINKKVGDLFNELFDGYTRWLGSINELCLEGKPAKIDEQKKLELEKAFENSFDETYKQLRDQFFSDAPLENSIPDCREMLEGDPLIQKLNLTEPRCIWLFSMEGSKQLLY